MKRAWPAVALSLVLAGCAAKDVTPVAVAPGADSALVNFLADKRALARQYEKEGRLKEALQQWRYVAAAAPADAEAKERVDELGDQIAALRQQYFKEGEEALAHQETHKAQIAYLKALLLDGSDEEARNRLREIDRTIALANQNRKDQKAMSEYRTAMVKRQDTLEEYEAKVKAPLKRGDHRRVIDLSDQFLKRNPDNKVAAEYRKKAYLALVDESRRRGNYRDALTYLGSAVESADADDRQEFEAKVKTVRDELADKLYSEGLSYMTSDLDRAIELLEQALTYNPEHLRAKQSLAQARKMRDTLSRIAPK
ncbi:MAG: hypothetical protein GC201_02425 [Alphaproteobacteria bacterium]|nr:hypothetical protein [Alphaproteobacteria bacterium]